MPQFIDGMFYRKNFKIAKKLIVKKLSDRPTRWSAKASAVLTLKCVFHKIKDTLTDFTAVSYTHLDVYKRQLLSPLFKALSFITFC